MVPLGSQTLVAVRTLLKKSFFQQKLLIEASINMLAARLIIKLVPFRLLSGLLDRRMSTDAASPEESMKIAQQVRWAIDRTIRHLPFRLVCFPRGVAAYQMLRRRGVDARLFYGISNRTEKQFSCHVWVKYGKEDVVGCENINEYSVMMTYPESASCTTISGNPENHKIRRIFHGDE